MYELLNPPIKKRKTTLVHTKMVKPKPSIVYDTYWRFAAARQDIFFKRLQGAPYPWTKDEILVKHKFTNVYRATDRVSQYLISNVIDNGSQEPNELFFRIILFKIFNRISTWEVLTSALGEVTFKGYSYEKFDSILTEVMNLSEPIYSAAYIMASGRSAFRQKRKHQNHLLLIEKMIKDGLPKKLQECTTMQKGYNLLLNYPSIGEFLAYQFITDINYSSLTDFSEMEFVKAGPGAKDGIRKCFTDFGDYSFEDIIKMMADQQGKEFDRLGLEFKNLWGRNLQLIDCQNIFCEVDKYSRIAHPTIQGYSNRSRIKQKYTNSKKERIEFHFPLKWELNYLPNE